MCEESKQLSLPAAVKEEEKEKGCCFYWSVKGQNWMFDVAFAKILVKHRTIFCEVEVDADAAAVDDDEDGDDDRPNWYI